MFQNLHEDTSIADMGRHVCARSMVGSTRGRTLRVGMTQPQLKSKTWQEEKKFGRFFRIFQIGHGVGPAKWKKGQKRVFTTYRRLHQKPFLHEATSIADLGRHRTSATEHVLPFKTPGWILNFGRAHLVPANVKVQSKSWQEEKKFGHFSHFCKTQTRLTGLGPENFNKKSKKKFTHLDVELHQKRSLHEFTSIADLGRHPSSAIEPCSGWVHKGEDLKGRYGPAKAKVQSKSWQEEKKFDDFSHCCKPGTR